MYKATRRSTVLLKGSGFAETAHLFRAMLIFIAVLFHLAIWRYRKTV